MQHANAALTPANHFACAPAAPRTRRRGAAWRALAVAVASVVTLPAWAATYTFTAPNYYSGYGANPAPGAPYTTAMHASGSFTTAAPLPANMPITSIGPSGSNLVTSWSFNNGLLTFNNTNSALTYESPVSFQVSTDAAGQIVNYQIQLIAGPPPHTVGQSVAQLNLTNAMTVTTGNGVCSAVNGSSVCVSTNQAVATQHARFGGAGTWARSLDPAAVPALAPAGLALLAAAMGLGAARRQRAARRPSRKG